MIHECNEMVSSSVCMTMEKLIYLHDKHTVTTNPENPETLFIPRFFHPILKEGGLENKKVDIEPHHVKRLYGVLMAQMLQGDA